MEINEKSGRQPYVVDHKGKLDVWFLTPGELNKYKNEYRMTIRAYMSSDKNIFNFITTTPQILVYKVIITKAR